MTISTSSKVWWLCCNTFMCICVWCCKFKEIHLHSLTCDGNIKYQTLRERLAATRSENFRLDSLHYQTLYDFISPADPDWVRLGPISRHAQIRFITGSTLVMSPHLNLKLPHSAGVYGYKDMHVDIWKPVVSSCITKQISVWTDAHIQPSFIYLTLKKLNISRERSQDRHANS